MNSQFLVFIQVLIAIGFVLWIVSRRGGTPKPTILNLSNDKSTAKSEVKSDRSIAWSVRESEQQASKTKVLNVIFMWNGHSWDAYEVLGLPAGTPIERVRQKFSELQVSTDQGQKEFLMAAMEAIENKSSS